MATGSKRESSDFFIASYAYLRGLTCSLNAAASQRSRSGSEGVDSGRQARQFAGDSVAVHHTLGDRTVQLRLCFLKRGLRGFFIARADRALDLFYESPDAALPGTVDRGAFFGLANAFFR